MQLTEEQILSLAPDEASKKAGSGLASPASWVSKGYNENALWGECKGSGAKPYQTQIDLTSLAFKCTCPSRKFPCKHGLGLLLFRAKQSDQFKHAEPPDWVSDWLEKRTERAEKKEKQKDKPVDEVAQAKRVQEREKLIEEGLNDLQLWLKDFIRNGIVNLPEKGTAGFNAMAKRMIDAKAPGLASMIKEFGHINFYKEGWQHYFMQQVARLYLVLSGFKNKENIQPDLWEDVKTSIGFTHNTDDLKQQGGIQDIWMVIGKESTEEDNLTTEKNWLFGTQTNQYALVLQFSVRGQGFSFAFSPGMFVDAVLVFYPSSIPLRALVKNYTTVKIDYKPQGLPGWMAVSQLRTAHNARLPFLMERPFLVHQLNPVYFEKKWWLMDAEGFIMATPEKWGSIYRLLSISGGMPLDMAVKARENFFEPLGVWSNNQFITL